MFSYYIELLDKPEYMLSSSEQAFIDLFPFLIIGALLAIIYLVVIFFEWLEKRAKKKKDKCHPCKNARRYACMGCPYAMKKEENHD